MKDELLLQFKDDLNKLSKSELLKQFKEIMDSLFTLIIGSIKKICPKDKVVEYVNEIEEYNTQYNIAMSASIEFVLREFSLSILEYAPQIYSKDEKFFLQDKTETTDIKGTNVNLNMMKHLWQNLNNTDNLHIKIKATIIDKTIKLTAIGEIYFTKYIDV